ncbi:serpin B6 [Caerostris extrusa]|uniref:Serpin B6 n=1 Tax=Caerostris extrusa TaxID=172846 RepID=A0AAV4TIY0_CAEEX|nr:serpin B6 [Caerostris extrusa]
MGANQSTQITAQVSHHLALSLLRELSQGDPANIFVSPFSIANAVSMLYCGTRSETANEISEFIGLEDISREDLTNAFDVFLTSLEKSSEAFSLECANALLIQEGFPVEEGYKDVLQKSFRAMLLQADIARDPDSAVGRVNGWVKDKTRGMIGTLVDRLDPSVVVILLNAVYFKGTWEHQFNKNSTRLQNFYNHGDKDRAKRGGHDASQRALLLCRRGSLLGLAAALQRTGRRHVDSVAPLPPRLGRGDGAVDTSVFARPHEEDAQSESESFPSQISTGILEELERSVPISGHAPCFRGRGGPQRHERLRRPECV